MKVYIVLTDTGTILSETIKMFTKAPYNHASIALDRNLENVYSFGRKKVHNPFNGGFVKEDLRNPLFITSFCEVYEVELTKLEYETIERTISLFEQNKHLYVYNFTGLITALFKQHYVREHAFFCSQFVAHLFKEAGVTISEKPLHYTEPEDFRHHERFQLVYKGSVSQYFNVVETLKPEMLIEA